MTHSETQSTYEDSKGCTNLKCSLLLEHAQLLTIVGHCSVSLATSIIIIMAELQQVFVPRLGRHYSLSFIHNLISKASKILVSNNPSGEQVEAVTAFLMGKDVFVALPTGSGKSLIYSCLPSVFDALKNFDHHSIVIVIAPLLSLMRDQVEKLVARGIKATYIILCQENKSNMLGVVNDDFEVVFLSPESILSVTALREMLHSKVYMENLVGVTVDEVHLIEKWYYDIHYS